MAPKAPAESIYPLYNTTFTTSRVSPLYHGSTTFDNTTLSTYASQLRDLLVGDVLRGVRVGLADTDDSLARVGALKVVQWTVLKDEEHWPEAEDVTRLQDESTIESADERGLHLSIQYERATYTALLLKTASGSEVIEESHDGFTHYPLLLTRMPRTLLTTLTTFLSTTFDTHISPLRIPSATMTAMLENYISNITQIDADATDQDVTPAYTATVLQSTLRDIQLTLTITLPSKNASLRAIDITIPKSDLHPLLQRGRKLAALQPSTPPMPFMAAIAYYIQGHLALDMAHEAVAIGKIACGGFVLGTEGKLKLFAPIDADGDGTSLRGRAGQELMGYLLKSAMSPINVGS